MRGVDVRRLAALDMHGAAGTRLRRTLIILEFLGGATLGPALGLFVLVGADSLGWQIFALWVVTGSLNYVPLAVHALSLVRSEALAHELKGVDIERELRYYTFAQVWVLVPLALVVLAPLQRREHRGPDGS